MLYLIVGFTLFMVLFKIVWVSMYFLYSARCSNEHLQTQFQLSLASCGSRMVFLNPSLSICCHVAEQIIYWYKYNKLCNVTAPPCSIFFYSTGSSPKKFYFSLSVWRRWIIAAVCTSKLWFSLCTKSSFFLKYCVGLTILGQKQCKMLY